MELDSYANIPMLNLSQQNKEIFPTSLLLGTTLEGEEVRISDDDNLKHLVVLGKSGCGKTSFLLGLIYQQIQRGGGYVFIDGKVSRRTINQIYDLSRLAMRESLFRIFNPSDPTITHTYNPLAKAVQDIDKSNVAESLIKLLDPIPEGSLAQHYHTLTLNLLHRVVKIFHSIGKAATIRDVLEVLGHMEVVYPILAEEIKDAHMMRDLVEYHKAFQSQLLKAREEKFEGLDAKLSSILASKAASALCSPGSDIDFYNAIIKQQNVYIGLPMDRDPSIAAGLGRLILTDIRFAIAEVLDRTDYRPSPPFLIVLDEFGSYATPDFSVVFEKSREANVMVVAAIQSLSNLTDSYKMLSRDFAERIMGNANKIFMALESTHTALEAERYWGEEIARKQSYQLTEGHSDSGKFLSPVRFINPHRSKTLQDRRGWVEGWESKIKADEFIHGLGIGEAYLRYNAKPTRVKLIRAELTPPEDLDLAQDLPRFSQGAEKALNLTEKVNQAISKKMEEKRKRELEGKPDKRKKNSKPKSQKPDSETRARHDQSIPSTQLRTGKKPSEEKTGSLQTGAKSDSSPPKPEHVTEPSRPSRRDNEGHASTDSPRQRRDKLDYYANWEDD